MPKRISHSSTKIKHMISSWKLQAIKLWRRRMANPLKDTVKRMPKKDDQVNLSKRLACINLLLYPETTSYNYNDVIRTIETSSHISSYAYIVHDRDFFTEETYDKKGHFIGHKGQKKDPHTHVVIALTSPSLISDISSWLGIPERFIEKCKNFENSLLYLTHRNAEDKVPYSCDEVTSNIDQYIRYIYNSYVPKRSPIQYLYMYLDTTEYPTYRQFIKFVPEEYWKDIRPYWSMIRDILGECKKLDKGYEEDMMKRSDEIRHMREAIKTLCEKFGTCDVDGDTSVQQWKLSEDGSNIDFMGFKIKE